MINYALKYPIINLSSFSFITETNTIIVHMITGNSITNIAKLNIDFEEKARELQHGNNIGVDETMARIRLMHYNNASIESMITSLDKYKQQKLETAATYAETTPGELLLKLINEPDNMFAYLIIGKTTSRMAYQEPLQYKTLTEQSTTIYELVNQPNSNKILANKLKSLNAYMETKSIDFTGKAQGASGIEYTVFIAAKYTAANGGAQDNQRNDLETFAEAETRIPASDNIIMVLLADGAYYNSMPHYNHQSFYDAMRSQYASIYNTRLIATTTTDFDVNMNAMLARI